MQLVVNRMGAGMSSNSRCWFCHAVPKFPLRWGVAALQLRVAVGGQHLRVGVDVDAPACSLFQQLLCVVEVVAGNHDERPLFNGQGHLHRFRIAKRAGVGRVQQLHAAVAGFSCGLHQLPQGVGGLAGVAHGLQGGTEEPVQFRVDAAQHPGVVVVGGHAPQAEQHKAFQAAPVAIRFPPEGLHIVVRAGAGAGVVHPAGQRVHGGGVKVHVGNGGEQPLHQQPGLFGAGPRPAAMSCPANAMSAPVSRSCAAAVSADLPHTPAAPVQAVQPAACSH